MVGSFRPNLSGQQRDSINIIVKFIALRIFQLPWHGSAPQQT